MFSEFFKEPLFPKSSIEGAMNAINGEFQNNQQKEILALRQLEKSCIMKKGCILNRFSDGNMQNVSNSQVQKYLNDFFKKNYSANLMTLALVGKHKLDELQEMA